ncbi:hypothetical protein CAPTEDRAFT_225165 [Capitella teleta]|uniref:Endonuclease/exonuclease/phosphatase domain-containing protein n=1 Tax=Capitella teleta TaxID=283909 RepID=R7TBF8_CAPTE|nr:hypothetical protein CAPTEDRAFT_225165 [Capitella teleta]|eukprot:ELT88817.1 hypothetical protein CAPTEDRAFT_225165 [Capitella teleta]
METYFVKRSWIPKPGIHDETGPLHDASMLRVMTYNILGDAFIKEGEYTYCPPQIRFMGGRHDRILQEVLYVNPDVLCLQEVSRPHFEENLEPDLYDLGYEGMHASYKDENKDGLAIFYKTERLQLTDQKACPALGCMQRYLEKYTNVTEADKAAILHLAERSQGCLLAKFQQKSSGRSISIGNIHIKWTMFSLPGLACFEAASAVHALKKFCDSDGSFVLMGDYNSTPDSAPYALTNTGNIDVEAMRQLWSRWPQFQLYPWQEHDVHSQPNTTYSVPWREVNTKSLTAQELSADRKLMKLLTNIIQTNTPLKSAYCAVLGKEPEITNCEAYAWPGYVHELCLDYIWYTRESIVLQNVLKTPSREIVRQQHGLPSDHFPSDHISLAAIFKLL